VFQAGGRSLLAVSGDGNVTSWDLATARPLGTVVLSGGFQAQDGQDVALSGDGGRLAGCEKTEGRLRVWDTASGREIRSFLPAGATALSLDGRRVAATNGKGTLLEWEVDTGRQVFSGRVGPEGGIPGLAYSPDGGHLVSACDNQAITIWDAASGEELHSHPLVGRSFVDGFAFHPDGKRMATAGEVVKVWDAGICQELLALPGLARCVAFSPDGGRLAAAVGNTVKVWDAHLGSEPFVLENAAISMAVSPDGQRLASACGYDGAICFMVWNLTTGQLVSRGGDMSSVSTGFSPDGQRFATVDDRGRVKVWGVKTGEELGSLEPPGTDAGKYRRVAFHPDGERLLLGGKQVEVWEARLSRRALAVPAGGAGVVGLAWSPDGRSFAFADELHRVTVCDAASGRELQTFQGPGRGEGRLAFSPDPDGRHRGEGCVAFSPDGRCLAAARGEDVARVWDLDSGRERLTLRGHDGPVRDVTFSPDGRRLATASEDRTVRVWDTVTGQQLLCFRAQRACREVLFHPNGRQLLGFVDGGLAHEVRVWDTEVSSELLRTAEVMEVVETLFGQHLPRDEVLGHLRRDAGLTEALREEALRVAAVYPEDPEELNRASWNVVKAPGAGKAELERALRRAEAACRIVPQGNYLTTLGAARFRTGGHAQALAALQQADQWLLRTNNPEVLPALGTSTWGLLGCPSGQGPLLAASALFPRRTEPSHPATLALLAMAYQRLGQSDRARATLAALRESLKKAGSTKDPDVTGLVREAETLIGERNR
jgi:WD40 repeat protein